MTEILIPGRQSKGIPSEVLVPNKPDHHRALSGPIKLLVFSPSSEKITATYDPDGNGIVEKIEVGGKIIFPTYFNNNNNQNRQSR